MRKYLDHITTIPNGFKKPQGVAYVVNLAKDSADRKKYIDNCFLKNSVTLALEDGGILENVPVLKHVWNDLEFPTKIKSVGSCVLWNSIPGLNSILVVGVIIKNNQVLNQKENQFSISRNFEKNIVEISGDAKNGILNITVDGGDDSGEIDISVFNKKKSAKLNLTIKGEVKLDVDGKTDFFVKGGVSIRNKDESFSKLLDSILDEFNNAIIVTPSGTGQVGPTTKANIEKLKLRIKKLFNES